MRPVSDLFCRDLRLCRFAKTRGFRLRGRDPSSLSRHEQTGYLVSGRLRLTVGDETFAAEPGDAWTVPSEVPHGGQALADTVAVEVFSPVLEDYLDP
ncbi:MAG: cupin domain-containing protein [Desulfobacterales bacterium]|nr:cupin domain-containing protein [Desulfobacterales bacterium]